MTRWWQIFKQAVPRLSYTSSLNRANLGLLTGSCVGALKVPVDVIDYTGLLQLRELKFKEKLRYTVAYYSLIHYNYNIRRKMLILHSKSYFYYQTLMPYKLEKKAF